MSRNINLHLKYIQPSSETFFDEQIQTLITRVGELSTLRLRSSERIAMEIPHTSKTIIEGLYQVFGSRYKGCRLSVPVSKSGYGDKPYQIANHSYSVVIRILDALKDLEWVDYKRGIKNKEGQSIPTSIKASGKLLEIFNNKGYLWHELSPISSDVIILKGYDNATRQKAQLTFTDNNQIRHWRKNLKTYNKFISKHAVCLSLDNGHLDFLIGRMANRSYSPDFWFKSEQKKEGRVFNFLQVQLRRIFARGSFEMGGRFYGGWWQFIPSDYRRYITINGSPTVEVDYSELHPRLMYLNASLPIPEGDLYDLGLRYGNQPYDKNIEPYKSQRKVIKTYINAIINDDRGRFRLNSSQIKILGMNTSQLEKYVVAKHPMIKEIKGEGYGLKFQFIDSQIAELVMMSLLKKKILCLPVHDSFICQEKHLDELREAMTHAYHQVLGTVPSLKNPEVFKTDFELVLYPSGQPDITYMSNQYKDAVHSKFLSSYFMFQKKYHKAPE